MINEWTDRLPSDRASEIWHRKMQDELQRSIERVERELHDAFERQPRTPVGFYEAMRAFLALREKMFPDFPADPAWKMLIVLAETPEGSDRASVTGIAHGAEVPLTTALRYLAAMESQGIIERVPDAGDHRRTIIKLTAEGRHRMDQIASQWTSRAWLAVGLIPCAVMLWSIATSWA